MISILITGIKFYLK